MRRPLFLIALFFSFSIFANTHVPKETDSIEFHISPDDAVLSMIDSLMMDKYYNCFK